MKRFSPRRLPPLASALCVLGAVVLPDVAWGQPAPEGAEPAPPGESATTKPDAPPSNLPSNPPPDPAPPAPSPAGDAEGEATQPATEADTVVDPADAEDEPAPPLGPPAAAEQDPKPVLASEETAPSRRVHLGFYAGVSHRSSESDRMSYDTAFAFGPSAGIEIMRWLRAEAYARFENIPVRVRRGGFDTGEFTYPDTTFEQPDLDANGLGFRLIPTWMILEQLGVQASFDILWTRFTAAAPATSGASEIRSAERAGVALNYKLGLGIVAEPILNWLEVAATGSYGIFTNQTGSAFEVLQGFDQNGYIVHLAPLPRFQNSLELLFTVALIL